MPDDDAPCPQMADPNADPSMVAAMGRFGPRPPFWDHAASRRSAIHPGADGHHREALRMCRDYADSPRMGIGDARLWGIAASACYAIQPCIADRDMPIRPHRGVWDWDIVDDSHADAEAWRSFR